MKLKVNSLQVHIGKVPVIHGASFEVSSGETVVLIGPNGAGKTTILRTIMGFIKVRGGDIFLNNREITNLSPPEVVRLGMTMVPQGRGLFPAMTLRDNLLTGAYLQPKQKSLENFDYVLSLFPWMSKRLYQKVFTLSGGEQQMVALARALMSDAEFLILDEPTLGLAPQMIHDLSVTIMALNSRGKTILLVEQNAMMALHIGKRGYILENGFIQIHDDCKELLMSDRVKKIYLGFKI